MAILGTMFEPMITWSLSEYPDLPWRVRRSLYHTLVSEIMLQQTTVSTVLSHFDRFLKTFPTIECLAEATEENVCLQWKGLGYYRRARNLHKAAISICKNFDGKIPTDLEFLQTIPGIGIYTAHAIRAIGADKSGLAVDANLERVFSRIFKLDQKKGPALQKVVAGFIDHPEVQSMGPRHLNEALMDLGREICQSHHAYCEYCPMSRDCMAYKDGVPLNYPVGVKEKKADIVPLSLLRIIFREKDKVAGVVKRKDQWLEGQIECPTYIIEGPLELTQYPRWVKKGLANYKDLKKVKTVITKYRITNYLLEVDEIGLEKMTNDLGQKIGLFDTSQRSLHFSTPLEKFLQRLN